MAKKKHQTKAKVQVDALEQIIAHAAGIDVEAEEVFVVVHPDSDTHS